MTMYRHGALYVVESVSSHDSLLRALKNIDPRLFFEKQLTFDEKEVWCVVCDTGNGCITILEWRDENGNPIPELASGILDRVNAMERDGAKLAKRVIEANEKLQAEKRKAQHDAHEELAREYWDIVSGKKSLTIPRGVSLRMARDKMRARGINV